MIRQSGVTLVELMIVVVIIGIVAMAAVPLSSGWIDEARVNEGKALLVKAHAQAKAVSLRNPEGVAGDDPAAGFKLVDGSLLLVCAGATSNAGCASGGSRVVWQNSWPDGVTSSVTEVEVNNRGQILVGNSSINTGVTYALSRGSVTDDSDYNVFR